MNGSILPDRLVSFEARKQAAEGEQGWEHGGTLWKSAFGFGPGIAVCLLALGGLLTAEEYQRKRRQLLEDA